MCSIKQRWYGNKLMMKRLVVVIDPEGGSQKLFVKCLYHYKNHLKEEKLWRLIMRDLNRFNIDWSDNHAKSKGGRLLEVP